MIVTSSVNSVSSNQRQVVADETVQNPIMAVKRLMNHSVAQTTINEQITQTIAPIVFFETYTPFGQNICILFYFKAFCKFLSL